MSIELRREGAITFTAPLVRALFRDVRLTFGARGLFAFLWDLPDGWIIRLEHLATMGPEGRDALRSRLGELQQVGAIRIEAIRNDAAGNTIPGGRIAGKRWVLVAADRWAIEAPLARESSPGKGSTENRKTRSSVAPMVGKPKAKVLQRGKVPQEAAEPSVHARPANAAAAPIKTQKRRTRRPSGIVTWTPDDLPEAAQIEQQHSADDISAAVAELVAVGKEPVPGLIAREIERQRRERDATDRRAAAEAAHQARLNTPPGKVDAETRARGLALLPPTLRSRATTTETQP